MYLQKISFLLLFTFIFSCKSKNVDVQTNKKTTSFYVGTSTNKRSTSQGIYQSSIDENGKMSPLKLVAKTENPSYLATTANKKYLISTNSGGAVGLSSFKIQKDRLSLINTSSTGQSPCYVSTKNGYVLTANYLDGTINLHQIDKNGKLSSILATLQHSYTTKNNNKRQQRAFAHSCYFEPNSDNIISIDLGANKIIFSTIDRQRNQFVLNTFNELEMPKESGPRLLTFHPTLPIFYVVNELSSTVTVVQKNTTNNTYHIVETKTTLPTDFKDKNSAAHIEITKDGRFLYMSNRGHNSIAVFSVASNGKLTFVERVSVRGKHPRNFSLSTDNRFLVVANRDTNNICSFKRDPQTGKLTFIDEIEAPKATCILF